MRRQTMIAGAALLGAVVLTALVAYRMGLRSGNLPPAPAAGGPGCVDIRQASSHTGEDACVSGRVLRVFTSKAGTTFLDFCQDYHNCPFTSVIFASDRPHFGDLSALQGRRVELRGTITSYRNQPEIVVREPGQIREAP